MFAMMKCTQIKVCDYLVKFTLVFVFLAYFFFYSVQLFTYQSSTIVRVDNNAQFPDFTICSMFSKKAQAKITKASNLNFSDIDTYLPSLKTYIDEIVIGDAGYNKRYGLKN